MFCVTTNMVKPLCRLTLWTWLVSARRLSAVASHLSKRPTWWVWWRSTRKLWRCPLEMEPTTSTWSRVRTWHYSGCRKTFSYACESTLICLPALCPSSCRHRRWYQRSGGNAGCHVQWLRLRSVPLPRAPPAGARTLVLHPNVQVLAILLLQELRLHTGSLLVLLLQWILLTGQQHLSWSRVKHHVI